MKFYQTNAYCKIYFSAPHTFVRWFRNDLIIADSQHLELPPPPRVTLFVNGSLQVKNVQIEDTNEYLCEVMTTENQLESQLHAIEVQCEYNLLIKIIITARFIGLFQRDRYIQIT